MHWQVCRRHETPSPHCCRCCVAGTGPDGLLELEKNRAGWGVSLSLVHLPPGVRLLMYHRAKGTMTLQHGANMFSGQTLHMDFCAVSRTCGAAIQSARRSITFRTVRAAYCDLLCFLSSFVTPRLFAHTTEHTVLLRPSPLAFVCVGCHAL